MMFSCRHDGLVGEVASSRRARYCTSRPHLCLSAGLKSKQSTRLVRVTPEVFKCDGCRDVLVATQRRRGQEENENEGFGSDGDYYMYVMTTMSIPISDRDAATVYLPIPRSHCMGVGKCVLNIA